MPSDQTIAHTLLPEIQSLLTQLGTQSGFQLVSGFADRHGAWEMRLAAKQPSATGFISFACDVMPNAEALSCELTAGFSKGNKSEKHLVGTFKLKSLSPSQSLLLERKFQEAVKATGVASATGPTPAREAEPLLAGAIAPPRYAIGK
jgi:hypothetical protein